jgi:cell shape-determining protein MreC
MKKKAASYFLLALLLFFLLNLPDSQVNRFRSRVLFAEGRFSNKRLLEGEGELLALKIENKKIKDDLEEVRSWIESQDRIDTHVKRIEGLLQNKSYSAFYQRRIRDLIRLLEKQVYSVEAKVIFRDPSFWGSGFWIDKGEKDNRELDAKIISKNSPVLFGDSLIGIVEIVEEKRAYVRLLTDSLLTPAVRAIRGEEGNLSLIEKMNSFEDELQSLEDLIPSSFFDELHRIKKILNEDKETLYLAKGELRGASYTLWRNRSPVLKGIGFNYEFSDEEGEAHTIHDKLKHPLLKVGDLLITSGLDGVFPPGLPVAIVSKIFSLKEGDFAYEIEATLTAGNLDLITHVQIYPPY